MSKFKIKSKTETMNKLKNTFKRILIATCICSVIYGIGYIKYKVWRAEHPNTETWIFFIPEDKYKR